MPRLVDANEILKPEHQHYDYMADEYYVLVRDIENAPTVDAEPVVRCDDCIYRDGKTPGQPNILCWQMHSDDYCSYGTKREVGTYCENIVSVVRCKDCKYFHYNKVYNIQGFPIMGNYVCDKWANGCQTDENGYCFLGERKEDATND